MTVEQKSGCANLRDQQESQQAADGADGQQKQLPPAALAQDIGEQVYQWCHQTFQTDKLEGSRRLQWVGAFIVIQYSAVLTVPRGLDGTWLSSPSRMTMEKKHTDHSWGMGIMATARG